MVEGLDELAAEVIDTQPGGTGFEARELDAAVFAEGIGVDAQFQDGRGDLIIRSGGAQFEGEAMDAAVVADQVEVVVRVPCIAIIAHLIAVGAHAQIIVIYEAEAVGALVHLADGHRVALIQTEETSGPGVGAQIWKAAHVFQNAVDKLPVFDGVGLSEAGWIRSSDAINAAEAK